MDSPMAEAGKPKRPRRQSEIALHATGDQLFLSGDATPSEDTPICWICLDTARPHAELLQPCACPRHAHAHCLARWQLQSAGSRRETHCEFCDQHLPDWKKTLTPSFGANAPAVMNVNFDGRTYSFEVHPGPDGYQQFTDAIRRAFSLPDDSELNITFTCDEPTTVDPFAMLPAMLPPPPPPPPPPLPPAAPPAMPLQAPMQMLDPAAAAAAAAYAGSLLTLQGAGAYDAAVHCASVSAARRMLQQRYMGDILPMHPGAAYRPELGAGPAVASSAGAGEAPPQPPSSTASSAEGGRPRKRLPAAFSRKLRNICDMLSLK